MVLEAAHEVIDAALAADLQDAIKKPWFGFFLFEECEVGPEGVGKSQHMASEAYKNAPFGMRAAQVLNGVLG